MEGDYTLAKILLHTYFNAQKSRLALEKQMKDLLKGEKIKRPVKVEIRPGVFRERKEDYWVFQAPVDYRIESSLNETWKELYGYEKYILEVAESLFEGHPIWSFCERVRGLGKTGALTLLAICNPYKFKTAARLRSYLGLVSEKSPQLAAGSEVARRYSRWMKARVVILTKSMIMQKDEYYYPLYLAKKAYYIYTSPYGRYLENPKVCPRYRECVRRLKRVKEPRCRAHINAMAQKWLCSLLVSNALEINMEAEGMDTSHIRSHWNYIPPKPSIAAIPSEENIRNLIAGRKWGPMREVPEELVKKIREKKTI